MVATAVVVEVVVEIVVMVVTMVMLVAVVMVVVMVVVIMMIATGKMTCGVHRQDKDACESNDNKSNKTIIVRE